MRRRKMHQAVSCRAPTLPPQEITPVNVICAGWIDPVTESGGFVDVIR